MGTSSALFDPSWGGCGSLTSDQASEGWEFHCGWSDVGFIALKMNQASTVTIEYAREDVWDSNCKVSVSLNGADVDSVPLGEGDSKSDRRTATLSTADDDIVKLAEGTEGGICGVHVYSICVTATSANDLPAPTGWQLALQMTPTDGAGSGSVDLWTWKGTSYTHASVSGSSATQSLSELNLPATRTVFKLGCTESQDNSDHKIYMAFSNPSIAFNTAAATAMFDDPSSTVLCSRTAEGIYGTECPSGVSRSSSVASTCYKKDNDCSHLISAGHIYYGDPWHSDSYFGTTWAAYHGQILRHCKAGVWDGKSDEARISYLIGSEIPALN
jgi:hypothetical protein